MQDRDQQANPYYLGVDGGGSKTLAIVVDAEGHEVGRGQAGGSNHNNVGLESALYNMRLAISNAAETVGSALPFRKAWLGISGLDRPADHVMWREHLHDCAEVLHMTNDGELGLSALEGGVGITVIAGTGSIILGVDGQGQTTRAGGWGYALGDEGSGYYIAQKALIAAVHAADGRGPQTRLLEMIMLHWGIAQPEDIIGEVYIADFKAKIARLSRGVFQMAREGDVIAQEIAEQGAKELALAVHTVYQRLEFPEQKVPLALIGGLLVNESEYRARFLNAIRDYGHEIGQVEIVEEPALSAARAAVHLPENE